MSAVEGLGLGTTLLARDRERPMPAAMLLMWDARRSEYDRVSGADRRCRIRDHTSNETGWTALLGDRRGTADVSIYAAPARRPTIRPATAYIEAGSAEVFRDEAVALASGIWQVGGSAELHIWAGGSTGSRR